MTQTTATSPDPTMPDGVFCPVHGQHAPAAYLGRERYGCWHCNPTRPTGASRRPAAIAAPESEYEVGDMPAWMTETAPSSREG